MLLNYSILAIIFCIGVIKCDNLVGAPSNIDEDDLKQIKPLLDDSLFELKGQEDGTELRLLRILEATSQVVSGKLYSIRAEFEAPNDNAIKNCKISLWHQPWAGFRQTKFNCDGKRYEVTKTKQRNKREAVVGGPTDIDDPVLIEELRKNISESFVQLQSEGKTPLQLKEILGAKKKVVAGILYTVNTMVESPDGQQKCTIEVWVKPWINFRQISVKCDSGDNYQVTKDDRPKRSSSLLRPLIPVDEQTNDQLNVDSDQFHFDQFKQNFARSYLNDEEEALRYRVFQNNLYLIRQLNKFEQGTATYGITEFADLTQDEYFQRTGLLAKQNIDEEYDVLSNDIRNPLADIPNIKLPKSHDWRDYNAVTPVKNQGNCGSCWSFSVTGNVEGLNAIQSGTLKSFSEQELVDCDDLDAGCNGGLPDNAYKFIEKEGGLELESDYPYTAHKNRCSFNSTLSRVKVSGVIDFKQGDEDGMAKWLTANGKSNKIITPKLLFSPFWQL